jgi:hypothetical protein
LRSGGVHAADSSVKNNGGLEAAAPQLIGFSKGAM